MFLKAVILILLFSVLIGCHNDTATFMKSKNVNGISIDETGISIGFYTSSILVSGPSNNTEEIEYHHKGWFSETYYWQGNVNSKVMQITADKTKSKLNSDKHDIFLGNSTSDGKIKTDSNKEGESACSSKQ